MRRSTALFGTALAAAVAAPAAPAAAAAPAVPPYVFSSDADGDHEIYLRRADGRVLQLTHNRVDDAGATFSPDGRKIAYTTQAGGDAEIVVMNADGTGQRRLTDNRTTPDGGPADDFSPAWSPDGRSLAFVSSRQTNGGTQIYRMNADGSGQRALTRTPAWVTNNAPTWSPDGRYIAFGSDLPGVFNVEVYRMRADGTQLQRLTHTAEGIDDGMPDYSPDGRTIVFSSTRDSGNWDLWTMDAHGRKQARLGGDAALDDVFPRWAPDGGRVLYMTFAGYEGTPPDGVWMIDRDGSDAVRLGSARANEMLPDPRPTPGR